MLQVSCQGHERLRISDNEWVSRQTASGRVLMKEVQPRRARRQRRREAAESEGFSWKFCGGMVMLVGWAIVVAPSAFPAAGARQHEPSAQSSRVRIVFATLQRLTRCCWLAGIKLGWAARWRKPGLRYPLAALASGCFHGYWSGAVGGAASSLVAAALGGACGHSGEGYVGLHTALLVIVAFFSVAMAARLHVRPATEALAAAQRKLTPVLPGLPQDLPPTPGDGIIPTPAPSSDDGGEVRSGNEWAAHCFGLRR